jgi:hypothetical protein
MNHPMLFAEKLWIVVGICGLLAVAVVIRLEQIKRRKTKS